MTSPMKSKDYFQTPIWVEQQLEWVKPLNKICDSYIKEAKNFNKDKIKEQKGYDFGMVHHYYDLSNQITFCTLIFAIIILYIKCTNIHPVMIANK